MHLLAPEQGILGTVPIVAGTVPLAAGAAMAYKLRNEPNVALAFFGDGTLEEGHVHESMNLAALYRLPVIFLCENNLYSSHMHWSERRIPDNLDQAGEFHSAPGQRVDGNDVEAVFDAMVIAVARARSGEGPSFLECRTFRWRGHVGASSDVDVGVQRRGELAWLESDPIARVEERLREASGGSTRRGPPGNRAGARRARRAPAPRAQRIGGGMRILNYAQAIREAHAQLLASDPRVFVIGQGLWSPWYAGASLEGLDREFSRDRIIDSPVSENAITGLAVGAALAGMRPIVFHPRMDFMLLAVDPIVTRPRTGRICSKARRRPPCHPRRH